MPTNHFSLVAEVVAQGIQRHEASWLVDEFAPGGDELGRRALSEAVERRLRGEPLQYILGHWPFRSLDVEIDERVLIPRPETEELVDHALNALARTGSRQPLLLDLGCGSGVIGLALLGELADRGVTAQLVAVDRRPDALAVARRNALKHQLMAVTFVVSSWFDSVDVSLRGRVDLVVSNPPYVENSQREIVARELTYEPDDALYADDGTVGPGTADLEEILREARAWLAPGGAIVLEHGYQQGEGLKAFALACGYRDVEIHRDLAGHPRVLVAFWE